MTTDVEIELSRGTWNRLAAVGKTTTDQIAELSEQQLRAVPGLGAGRYAELLIAMHDVGLPLPAIECDRCGHTLEPGDRGYLTDAVRLRRAERALGSSMIGPRP